MWTVWLKGLIAAIISGVSSAVVVVIVDPHTFGEWEKLGKIALAQAALGAAAYLKRSPLPEKEDKQ
jgi:hypothetical protein